MPKGLTSCVRQVKADLKDQRKKWSNQRISSLAYAICRKSTGLKPHKATASLLTSPRVSFSESGRIKEFGFAFLATVSVAEKAKLDKFRPDYRPNDPDSKIVVGDASYDTTSKNFNIYREEELKKSAGTLIQKPCQVDHSTSARDTFGLVIDSFWDRETKTLGYVAELDSQDPVSGKVERGYIRNVSVAGSCEQVLCSICGEELTWTHEHYIGGEYDGVICKADLRGITFDHLGFTPFPAVEGASTIYVPTDIGESIDNAVAFMEYFRLRGNKDIKYEDEDETPNNIAQAINNQNIGTFPIQESFTMDEATKELFKEKQKEIEKVNYQLSETQKELETTKAKVAEIDDLKEKIQAREADDRKKILRSIVKLELKTKRLEEKNKETRLAELEKKEFVALEAIEEFLEEIAENMSQPSAPQGPVAGSKAKNFNFGSGSKFNELDDSKKSHYIREAKLEKLQIALGLTIPSVSAVLTLKEYNVGGDRWNTELSDLIRQVPRKGAYGANKA